MTSFSRRLARCGVLTALALALSWVESLLPLTPLVPIPGFKLGLSNLVTVFALCRLGRGEALLILLSRCCLGALFAGNPMSLLFSLGGGLLAFAVMALLLPCRRLSLYGVCLAGAAAHNIGQMAVAVPVLGSGAVLAFLPPLLLVGLAAGMLTGWLSTLLAHRIPSLEVLA